MFSVVDLLSSTDLLREHDSLISGTLARLASTPQRAWRR
jgi:hypothetical protein